jgi:hypothetical protein
MTAAVKYDGPPHPIDIRLPPLEWMPTASLGGDSNAGLGEVVRMPARREMREAPMLR